MSAFLYKHQKVITVILIVVFVASIVPILMLAGFDCASGDDYNYGAGAHLSYLATGSIIQAVKAAVGTTVSTWHGWQGTWFDCFWFCLHPEVFSENGYVVVPYIFIIIQILSAMLFSHHFIAVKWKIDGWLWAQLALVYLIFAFQLVPSRKSAFFWWVGCIHYVMPFCLALVGIVLGDRYLRNLKLADLCLLAALGVCIGGATYPATLLLILAVFLLWFAEFVLDYRRDRKDLLLLIPLILTSASLFVSVIAPGNAVRSASDMENGGVASGGALLTIWNSIVFSVTDSVTFFLAEKTYILLSFVSVMLLSLEVLRRKYWKNKKEFEKVFEHPVLFVLVMFLLNAAMYAPRIYAGGVVSSGYLNFNFWTFFICTISCIIYLIGYLMTRELTLTIPEWAKILSFVIVVTAIVIFGRHGVKEYTDYECLLYYISGQAEDYKEQMRLQRYLMQEEGVEDVVVPEINDYQGPLMHMPIVADPENVDNLMTKHFYGKKSCRSIPREKWMEEYGVKYNSLIGQH